MLIDAGDKDGKWENLENEESIEEPTCLPAEARRKCTSAVGATLDQNWMHHCPANYPWECAPPRQQVLSMVCKFYMSDGHESICLTERLILHMTLSPAHFNASPSLMLQEQETVCTRTVEKFSKRIHRPMYAPQPSASAQLIS
jgi:hypothetical protein